MTAINTAVIHTINGKRFVGRALTLTSAFADCLWDITTNDGAPVAATGVSTTAWLDKGIGNDVTIDGTWVTSTGTPLDLKFYGTNDLDGVVIVPLAYVPAASGTGVTPAYPQDVPYAKTDWGNAATDYVGAVVRAHGWRYMKVQAHDASGVGTFTPGAVAFPAV